ncbi:hypothetical protein OTL63_004732 [Salmonella enterica]|nr:hypothetical protein [Salmonella enterica]
METALVPAGAAQPVSPVKTALVFLAGDPVPDSIATSVYPPYPQARPKLILNVTVSAKDAHGNDIPGWLLDRTFDVTSSSPLLQPNTYSPQSSDTHTDFTFELNGSTDDLLDASLRDNVFTVEYGNHSIKIKAPVNPVLHFCIVDADGKPYGYNQTGYVFNDTPDPYGIMASDAFWSLCLYDGHSHTVKALRTPDIPGGYLLSHVTYGGYDQKVGERLSRIGGGSTAVVGADLLGKAYDFVYDSQRQIEPQDGSPVFRKNPYVDHDLEYQQPNPTFLGYFVGFKSWHAEDGDLGNFIASAKEVCTAIGGSAGVSPYADYGSHFIKMYFNPRYVGGSDPIMSTTVQVYGGQHEVLVYAGIPPTRDDGAYAMMTQFASTERKVMYVLTVQGTPHAAVTDYGQGITHNVEGSYCTFG